MSEGVYLLHLDPPLHHARHYLGWSTDIPKRVDSHLAGKGSPLVRAALKQGSVITLARTWLGLTRNDERRMKDGKNVPRLCPLCSA